MKTRDTARTVLFNPQGEVLLFKYEDPAPADPLKPELTIYWGTPGGGLADGETFEEAAVRELGEETGIDQVQLGPCIWTRACRLLSQGQLVLFNERYFLARTSTSQISIDHSSELELSLLRDHRWWSMDALERSDETFLPPGFVELVRPVQSGAIPPRPIEIGQ